MGRLSGKESDRAAAIEKMLAKARISHKREGDVLVVEGMSLAHRLLEGRMPADGVYESLADHRMVMAEMLLGLPCHAVVPEEYAPLSKSMPCFRKLWDSVVLTENRF